MSIIRQYEIVRELGKDLNTQLVRSIPRDVIEATAKKLGFFKQKKLFFQNEHEMKVLVDYTLYHYCHEGQSIIDVYLANHGENLTPDQKHLLHTLQKARFCILEVKKVGSFGHVEVKDVIQEDDFLLIDKAMSMTANPGTVVVSNVIFFEEFAMTTGGPIPLADPKLASQVIQIAKKQKKQAYRKEEILKVLKLCLSADALSKIVYC